MWGVGGPVEGSKRGKIEKGGRGVIERGHKEREKRLVAGKEVLIECLLLGIRILTLGFKKGDEGVGKEWVGGGWEGRE